MNEHIYNNSFDSFKSESDINLIATITKDSQFPFDVTYQIETDSLDLNGPEKLTFTLFKTGTADEPTYFACPHNEIIDSTDHFSVYQAYPVFPNSGKLDRQKPSIIKYSEDEQKITFLTNKEQAIQDIQKMFEAAKDGKASLQDCLDLINAKKALFSEHASEKDSLAAKFHMWRKGHGLTSTELLNKLEQEVKQLMSEQAAYGQTPPAKS